VAHILLVDDEDSILFAMEQYIIAHGGTVDCARELEEAQALLANIHYHLVIADLRLSGMGGVEGLDLVSMVRECCPRTRVVVLTAFATPDVQREAMRRGADAFLAKSTPSQDVAEVVRGLLGCAA